MMPLWLPGEDHRDRLVLARRVEILARIPDWAIVQTIWPQPGLPVNLAAALNVLSDNSIAYANAEQTAPITQST